MIPFTCPKCGSALNAPDHEAGKQGRCGKCGCLFEVPRATSASPAATAAAVAAPHTAAFNPNLIACPICAHQISRFAPLCPSCGHPIFIPPPPPAPRPPASGLGIASFIIGAVGAPLFWMPIFGVLGTAFCSAAIVIGVIAALWGLAEHGLRAPLGFAFLGFSLGFGTFMLAGAAEHSKAPAANAPAADMSR